MTYDANLLNFVRETCREGTCWMQAARPDLRPTGDSSLLYFKT